jgi:Flp pilus assembly protein TadG
MSPPDRMSSHDGMPSSRRMSSRGPHSDEGAVTAEMAVALPALVLVTILLVWLVAVAGAHIRAADAAREAARSMARGDAPSDARSVVARTGPAGASVTVGGDAEMVTATVRARVRAPGALASLVPSAMVTATATAWREPEVPPASGGASATADDPP